MAGVSGTSQAFDLMQAWQSALRQDAGLAAAAEDYRAGLEHGPKGLAPLLPQVNLTGNYNHSNPISPQPSLAGDRTRGGETHGYNVSLTQPLFDAARFAGYREGQIRQDAARTTYETTLQQRMIEVAAAYFSILQAQDTLAATEAAKTAYYNQLQRAKTEFQIGTATITDANEAQAGYDSALADEIQARADLEYSQSTLTRLTGLAPDDILPLAPSLPLHTPDPATMAAWQELAMAHSLKIRAKEQALALAKQRLNEKRAGHLPVVQLTSSYLNTVSNDSAVMTAGTHRNRGHTVGVNVTLPLYSGGGVNSRVREATAELASARDQLEDTRRQTREEVRKAWLGVTSGMASIRAQQQRSLSAKSKLDSTALGKEVGIRTNLDLLQAQQDYTNVLKDLASARYRYLNARLQLSLAAGLLDEGVLQQINRTLQH